MQGFDELACRVLDLIQVAKKRLRGADLAAASALEGFILVLLSARRAVGEDPVAPVDLMRRATGRYNRDNLRLVQNRTGEDR